MVFSKNLVLICVFLWMSMCLGLLPSKMRVVHVLSTAGNVAMAEAPLPSVDRREVLINVEYSAVNRMDLVQARGLYPLPPGASEILGVEVSGVVVALGNETSRFAVGDRVMALLLGGGYADFCAVDERTVMKIPEGLDMLTAAAIPEAFITAYQLLFDIGKVRPGETVLMHAAASSVGQAAIQLASKKGIKVIATTRSESKVGICKQLGASSVIVVGKDAKFADEVRRANDGRGVDVILDPVGSSYLNDNVDAIDYDGRFVLYGLLSGGDVDKSFLRKLLFKRVAFLSSTLRARSVEYKQQLIDGLEQDAHGLRGVISGEVKVEIDAVFPFEEVSAAHAAMQANSNAGKIILAMKAQSSGSPDL